MNGTIENHLRSNYQKIKLLPLFFLPALLLSLVFYIYRSPTLIKEILICSVFIFFIYVSAGYIISNWGLKELESKQALNLNRIGILGMLIIGLITLVIGILMFKPQLIRSISFLEQVFEASGPLQNAVAIEGLMVMNVISHRKWS